MLFIKASNASPQLKLIKIQVNQIESDKSNNKYLQFQRHNKIFQLYSLQLLTCILCQYFSKLNQANTMLESSGHLQPK